MSLSCNEHAAFLKFSKFNTGPTFSFTLDKCTLSRHVREHSDKNLKYKLENIMKNNPMLVLQGFEKDEIQIDSRCKNISKALVKKYLDLLSIQINSLFPTLSLDSLKLKQLNRLILVKANV